MLALGKWCLPAAACTGPEPQEWKVRRLGPALPRKVHLYAQHIENGFQVWKNAAKRSTMDRAFRPHDVPVTRSPDST